MLSGGGMNHAHFYREKGSCDGRFLASGDVRRKSGDALERAVSIFCPIPAHLVLQTVSTAAGAGIAVWAEESITQGKCKLLYFVNCVIAATLCSSLTLLNLLIGGAGLQSLIAVGIASVLLIVFAYQYGKSIAGSLEYHKQITSKYEVFLPGMELIERFARQENRSVPDYIRYLRIESKRTEEGISEAEAAQKVDEEDRKRAARAGL